MKPIPLNPGPSYLVPEFAAWIRWEEEDILTIDVTGYEMQTQWGFLPGHVARSTIPELNAEHGFDPARDGTDVCEYFGWPLLEICDSSTGGE